MCDMGKTWSLSPFLSWKFYCLYGVRYHVPRSWFKPSGNILVIFEEKGGDPSQIRFSKRIFSVICAHLSEDHPTFGVESKGGDANYKRKAAVQLKCPASTQISTFKFASFGTPTGTCGSFTIGDCHDPNTTSLVEKVRNVSSVIFFVIFILIPWRAIAISRISFP